MKPNLPFGVQRDITTALDRLQSIRAFLSETNPAEINLTPDQAAELEKLDNLAATVSNMVRTALAEATVQSLTIILS